MDLINKFKHNKVVISWAVSYLAILLITAVFNFYTYLRIEDNMLKQIDKINIELLQNRRQYIDNYQVVVNNLASQIAYDPIVRDMALRTVADDRYKYDMLEVRKKIESWRYSDVEINNMYIYFLNTDYIVGGKTNTNSERYYQAYYSDKGISYDEYMKYLKEKNYSKYVMIPGGENSDKGDLFYFTTVFGVDYTVPLATVVLEIKTDDWVSFEQEDNAEKNFLILDKNGAELLYSDEQADFEKELLQKNLNADTSVRMDSIKNKVVLYTKSQQNDWVYMYAINNKRYTEVINAMRVRTGGMMLIWLVVGIYAAIFFVRRQHKPIRHLINRLEKNMDMNFSDTEHADEFIYINEWITKFIEEKKRDESGTNIQNKILRDAILLKLMSGTNSGFAVSAEESLKSLGVEFESEYFGVVLFYFEDLSEMFFETGEAEKADDYDLAKLIASNILSEIIQAQCRCVFCDAEGMLCCVINADNAYYADAAEAINKASEIIRVNFNIEFVAGMSDMHKGLETLMLCRNEAMQCLEHGFMEPEAVIVYEKLPKATNEAYHFPIEKEISMIGSLKAGDFDAAEMILDEILNINIEQNKISIQKARCLMCDIICAVMKALNDLGEPGEGGIVEQDKFLKCIEGAATVRKMRNEIVEIFRDICSKSAYKQSRRMAEIVAGVKEYINAYYDDSSLNGAAIAKHFYMNQSYLSNTFKKAAGCGMLEYLSEVRVKKAMELLKTTDNPIDVIAENVGFANVRTFTRTFSKYAGMPPGKFRGK